MNNIHTVEEEELKLADVTRELLKSLKRYPKKVAKAVLEEVHQQNEDLMELRDRIAKREEEKADLERELDKLLPQFRIQWEELQRRVRSVEFPTADDTGANAETLVMLHGYCMEPLEHYVENAAELGNRARESMAELVRLYGARSPTVSAMVRKTYRLISEKPYADALMLWTLGWLNCGFPRLEIGHKLAASLALTDIPDDIEVVAPWPMWSIVVPPNLLAPPGERDIARLWVTGTQVNFICMQDGAIIGPLYEGLRDEAREKFGDKNLLESIGCLIRGSCLALSNPDDYRKSRPGSAGKGSRAGGAPNFAANRFLLTAPVTVDVRQHLLDTITGKRQSGAPTIQFYVRGHWRNQAHGPGRALRKHIRIEGFWKGPNSGDIALRTHRIRGQE